ncbi:hypothetical protein DM860_008350 [Cuscuta australis]|uniref:Uncharacterized protein n=1 Tax=Cuscuta australis TaxID=267555 RepID=A0A328D501_9ASTE|nr:hypothetical protein DM860_008350 [Cuscuta australis]
MATLTKELSTFQITITTLILGLSMAFFVVTLGMFINHRYKKIMVFEDIYLPLHDLIPTLPNKNSCQHADFNNSYNNVTVKNQLSLENAWHSMSDDELLWRASTTASSHAGACSSHNGRVKVAFMFLARGRLPLVALWERFFRGHEGQFSIYFHISPKFRYDEPPQSSVFYKRRIPSKPVQWGRPSMIDAERRLLGNALLDHSNQRFVLLSESCIPLFNFTFIYDYLVNTNQSFLGSFDDPSKVGRGRYNKRMHPRVALSDWRKGSQWFEVDRELAIRIVSDVVYYPVFRDHCRPPCYADEHYLPTLTNILCPQSTSKRSVTWADWSRGGSHPRTYMGRDVREELLNGVKFGYNCSYNGRMSNVCFLFGRKFHASTLQPLLSLGTKVLGFN